MKIPGPEHPISITPHSGRVRVLFNGCKGDAAYYSIRVGEAVSENAIWSYEQPYAAVAEIAGRLAFYPDRVDAVEVMAA
jgi:uncharacterized protein (DUF427 family)